MNTINTDAAPLNFPGAPSKFCRESKDILVSNTAPFSISYRCKKTRIWCFPGLSSVGHVTSQPIREQRREFLNAFVVSEHIVPVSDFGENLPFSLCFEFGRGRPVIFTRNVYKLSGIVVKSSHFNGSSTKITVYMTISNKACLYSWTCWEMTSRKPFYGTTAIS